jgi:predicted nucleic acid-binding protein
MPAVSDTSILVAFHHLGDLELIPRLVGAPVFIPPSVLKEFRHDAPGWAEVRPLREALGPRILNASLGRGESDALALALELDASLILLDDLAARHVAFGLGLTVMGTAGLLLRAKSTGLIPAIRPKLDGLRSLPFHISSRLYDAVIAMAGE